VVDRNGLPLGLVVSGANVHNSKVLAQALDAVPAVRQPRGRPRQRPAKLHADKGYDFPRCRRNLRRRGIIPRIARRGVDTSQRLGRYRWVVERSFAWINQFRRLIVRYRTPCRHLPRLPHPCGRNHLPPNPQSPVLLGALS
jgi:IS5 family transposase